MRKTKVKEIQKGLVITCAFMLFAAGAAAFADDWDDFKSSVNTTGSASLSGNVEASSAVTITVPVPGGGSKYILNGQGHTVTAGTGLTTSVITNTADTPTDINNMKFQGSANQITTSGAAIANSGTMNITGTSNGNVNGNYDVTFKGHKVQGNGGAIENTGTMTITNALFGGDTAADGNSVSQNSGSNGFGGAVDNSSAGGTLTIYNSKFSHNSSDAFGGALSNRAGTANIYGSIFDNNTAATQGGAIVNGADLNITNSTFLNNNGGNYGGGISNALTIDGGAGDRSSSLTLNNTNFEGNVALNGGGAIYNGGSTDPNVTHTINVNGGTFKNNSSSSQVSFGGAIYNSVSTSSGGSVSIATINNAVFEGNTAGSKGAGGAIANSGRMTVTGSRFNSNGSYNGVTTGSGGAIRNFQSGIIANEDANLTINRSSFTNNVAANNGGAIYNSSTGGADHKAVVTIVDSTLTGNTTNAGTVESGGAIYGGNNSVTNITASQGGKTTIGVTRYTQDIPDGYNQSTDTISFAGNAEGNFNAASRGVVEINTTVRGDKVNGGSINVNKDGGTGVIHFKGYGGTVENADLHLYNGELKFDHDASLGGTNDLTMHGGTLNLLNGELFGGQVFVNSLTLAGNSNMKLDVDLANQKMDDIIVGNNPKGVANTTKVDNTGGFNLNISQMKSITEAKDGSARILFTDAPELIGHVTAKGSEIIEAPISKYKVTQETINAPSSGGTTPADNGEYFIFDKIGDSDSIIAAPVAAQAAFLLMDNLYRQSFANMDMVALMTPEQRMAWKMRNKYASAYHTGVFAPNVIPEERDGWYVRPFTNFENVPLKNGPKVSNVSYGTLIGGESDLVELGHGWDGNFSFFGAYHGSHQAYNGVSIWQNGGTFGGVATAYKGNFWTGVTANVGASAAEAHHTFGNDQFPILMTGAAWKSGYNWGLFKNKMIIQPSYMMSYTFVNVFDYNNAAGVRVTQDPLNAIEIIPGLRIIGNFKNGWQPYLGVNMTWNIMDRTKFYANEVALTELSVKPYIEYGVGLQKRYGDRFTGFGQAMLRNGGRNGIALTLGLRWALGN